MVKLIAGAGAGLAVFLGFVLATSVAVSTPAQACWSIGNPYVRKYYSDATFTRHVGTKTAECNGPGDCYPVITMVCGVETPYYRHSECGYCYDEETCNPDVSTCYNPIQCFQHVPGGPTTKIRCDCSYSYSCG